MTIKPASIEIQKPTEDVGRITVNFTTEIKSDGRALRLYLDGQEVNYTQDENFYINTLYLKNVPIGEHEIAIVRNRLNVKGDKQRITVKKNETTFVMFEIEIKKSKSAEITGGIIGAIAIIVIIYSLLDFPETTTD